MITAKMIQALREKTGAGMMDCKKALTAANGDIDAAIDNLRKSGAAKAEKKSDRATNQGKVWTAVAKGKGAIVEVLCETDFAAKTPRFGELVEKVSADSLNVAGNGDVTAALNESEQAVMAEAIGVISENMQIRRAMKFEAEGSVFAGYHHMDGRVSVLVEVEGEDDPAILNDICLHIAAFNPSYVDAADVPAEVIAKEKEIMLAADPSLAKKPAEMLEKIMGGKIKRFCSDICLRQQAWVKDDKTTLEKLKPGLKIKRFVRWAVGEEI